MVNVASVAVPKRGDWGPGVEGSVADSSDMGYEIQEHEYGVWLSDWMFSSVSAKGEQRG